MWYVGYDYYMSWYNYYYGISPNDCTEIESDKKDEINQAIIASINDPPPPKDNLTDIPNEEFVSQVWSQPRYLRQHNVKKKKNKKKK